MALAETVSAAPIDVDSTAWGDDGTAACTLWEAVSTVKQQTSIGQCPWPSDPVIRLHPETTYFTQGQFPELNTSLRIEGRGATLARDSSAPNARFFRATGSGTVLDLHDLTLVGGIAYRGGALWIRNQATLKGFRLRLESNFATTHGGAIFIGGTLDLDHSTLVGNLAGDGGAIWSYGGTVSITQSLLASNHVSNRGGALAAWSSVDHVTITNTTFSANKAYRGGAIYRAAGSGNTPDSVMQSTFADNFLDHPGTGSALYLSGSAAMELGMTALHGGTSNADLCAGDLSSLLSTGHNAATDASCALVHADDHPGVSFTLGNLLDNGAFTQVRAPRCDQGEGSACSILLDQYPCDHPGTIMNDQRGVYRQQFGGASLTDWKGHCDIGAYESICHATTVWDTGSSTNITNLIYPDQYQLNGTVLNSGACAGVGMEIEIPEEHSNCELSWQMYFGSISALQIEAIWFLDDTKSCPYDCYENPTLCRQHCTLDPKDWTAPLAGLGLVDPTNGSPDPINFTLVSPSCDPLDARYVMQFSGGITDDWDPEVKIKVVEPPNNSSTGGGVL